jgi:hypothetical protein
VVLSWLYPLLLMPSAWSTIESRWHLAGGDACERLHETLVHNDVARIRATFHSPEYRFIYAQIVAHLFAIDQEACLLAQ